MSNTEKTTIKGDGSADSTCSEWFLKGWERAAKKHEWEGCDDYEGQYTPSDKEYACELRYQKARLNHLFPNVELNRRPNKHHKPIR